MPGKFITLEGIDGAGKSTHLAWIADWLTNRGIAVTVTREPGGTEFGEKIRKLILERRYRLHAETEALLMFAARREHLDKVILPALAAGRWVLCDRFTDATYAYQAAGSGVAWKKIELLEEWVQGELRPDLTICLDVDPAVGRERSRHIKSADRFEQEPDLFHERVREAYLRRAKEYPERIRVVDANAPIHDIQQQLEKIFSSICF
jgi:dTMP kinase